MSRSSPVIPSGSRDRGPTHGSAERPEAPGSLASTDGAVPYRLRIGVTGHRNLPDDPALAEQVGRALQRIRELTPESESTPVCLAVVSPLAEGSDRLVARQVIEEKNTTLEVPLPMPAEDYMTDFQTEESRREFEGLMKRATMIVTLPRSETREQAYERAGRYVVERSDVLIALWDGQPARGQGGTAEIVELARERGMPVFWIETEFPFRLTEELGDGIRMKGFEDLDDFNRQQVEPEWLASQVEREANQLLDEFERAGLPRESLQPYCNWILPYYVRADTLAGRYQKRFFRMGSAIFYFSAGAAAVVAVQKLFFADYSWIVALEVLLMLAILGFFFLSRRWRIHERWVSYRFLSEHFRCWLFLAVVGVGCSREESAEQLSLQHPSEEWLSRVIDEVWGERPVMDYPDSIKDGLRRFLASAWIGGQLSYQRKASHRNEKRHDRLTRITIVIFAATLVAAMLHTVGVGKGELENSLGATLVFLAIVLPALAGALHGIGAQREYMRNAERSKQMVPYLATVKQRMEHAPDLPHVRAIAQEAESLMLSEIRDWFVVMQFHDIELHV